MRIWWKFCISPCYFKKCLGLKFDKFRHSMKTFRNKDEIETCFKYLFMKTVHFPFLGFGNEKKQEKVQSISGGIAMNVSRYFFVSLFWMWIFINNLKSRMSEWFTFYLKRNIIFRNTCLYYTSLPIRTAFVGVCIFFLDSTTTMAELAISVMSMKKGAIKPGQGKWENNSKNYLFYSVNFNLMLIFSYVKIWVIFKIMNYVL